MTAAGAIERLGPDVIAGWAAWPGAGGAKLALVLEDLVHPIERRIERPDIAASGPPSAGPLGFSVPYPEVLARWRAFKPREPNALPKWVALVVGRDVVANRSMPDLRGATGALLGVSDGWLEGWISTDDVEVDLRIDGLLFARTAFREFPPSGNPDIRRVGFAVRLPLGALDDPEAAVTAEISLTGASLAGSPLTVRSPSLEAGLEGMGEVLRGGGLTPRVSIVVPVFNAAEDVGRSLRALVENTGGPARLLIIDDASSDPAVARVLGEYDGSANVTILRRTENQGYTATVNQGLRWAAPDDVVVLNSDTLVPPRWLENLRLAAGLDPAIATVTPLSDNAGPFSAPEPDIANPLPPGWTPDDLGRAVTQSSICRFPETPTAHGFCTYLRRACLDEIGAFDLAAFPRGYGEENDFSMRAARAGWRHVVDDRTLVVHARSASFGEGLRRDLSRQGNAVVNDRFPEYAPLVRDFLEGAGLNEARYRVRRAVARSARPRLLTVIATLSGGTPLTNDDMARALLDRFEVFVLHSDSRQLTLFQVQADRNVAVASTRLQAPIQLAKHFSAEYDRVAAAWATRLGIELVHVRHIGWHSLGLPWACRQLGIPVVFSFHDFYTVCPTVKLLDEHLRFCAGRCTPTPGPCRAELWEPHQVPGLKHRWVNTWKEQTADMLDAVDAFVTTSASTRATILANFPELGSRPFRVIPHGRDFESFGRSAPLPGAGEPLRLLALGMASTAKGADLLAEMAASPDRQGAEIHVLGAVAPSLANGAVVRHGAYAREEVLARIGGIRPHIGLVLSLWPETYCHTLTELWAAGVPVVALDRGAVGERIREHGGGWLVEGADARLIWRVISGIAADPAGYRSRLDEINTWQRATGARYGTKQMARSYSALYDEVLAARRPFKGEASTHGRGLVADRGRRPAATAR